MDSARSCRGRPRILSEMSMTKVVCCVTSLETWTVRVLYDTLAAWCSPTVPLKSIFCTQDVPVHLCNIQSKRERV